MITRSDEERSLTKFQLENFLNHILRDESFVSTFILTTFYSHQNRLAVKVENVSTLQWFAEQTTKPDLKFLKTRPIRLHVKRTDLILPDEHNLNIEVAVVPKLFLNGTRNATNKFVSVCISCVSKQDEIIQKDEELIVSIFLKNPNIGEPVYRKDFKMRFSAELEQNERGLFEFISKKDFAEFVSEEDCATFGVLVQFAPNAQQK